MHLQTKKFMWLASLQYLLYRGRLKPNLNISKSCLNLCHLDKGNLCLALRQKGREERALPVSVVFHLSLTQNSLYARVEYSGVAYFIPLYCKSQS